MTNVNNFIQRVEITLLRRERVDRTTCDSFSCLPLSSRSALGKAMIFLGCDSNLIPTESVETSESERIIASRLMLLSLYVDSGVPRWSSYQLKRLLESVMSVPGGGISDVFRALLNIFSDYSTPLTGALATFITKIVVASFTRYRDSYESISWQWMAKQITEKPTPAMAYISLLAIPPADMNPECAIAILRELAGTSYWNESLDVLSDDLKSPEARLLLENWIAEGIYPIYENDIRHRLLKQ